jgi:hypothetical protein
MLQTKKRFWGSKPGFDMGDILHIGVNLLFVAVIYATVELWGLASLAIVLVLLSKWRVFAVQPRFWLPNIRTNLVDLIVGISTVILSYQATDGWVSFAWMVLYVAWLLFVKPQTQELWVGVQALWAQLLGLVSIFMVSMILRQPLVVCVLAWLVAWSAARHYFSNYEEPHYRSLGLIWGFLVMQISWISIHWIQYYIVFNTKIATSAIIITVISASLGSIYHAHKNNVLHRGILIENVLFASALVAVVLATSRWAAVM